MVEGLYAVRFRTTFGEGSGVVVLDGGRFRGGDSRMAYSGVYSVSGTMLSADVTVFTHTDNPKLESSFGLEAFSLSLHGNFAAEPPTLIGISPNASSVDFRATLHRLDEPAAGPRLE
jgi:hypothetical protein